MQDIKGEKVDLKVFEGFKGVLEEFTKKLQK